MYGLTLVTPPAEEPLSLADAKLHLREDGSEQDTLISSLIKSARIYCENFLNQSLVTQTWDLTLDEFPREIVIPRGPLQSVTSIAYVDDSGVTQTLATTQYQVDVKQNPGRIVEAYEATWPTLRDQLNTVVIRYVAGYGLAAAVPENIKAAMKLLLGHWYENREETISGPNIAKVPTAADALLWQERVVAF